METVGGAVRRLSKISICAFQYSYDDDDDDDDDVRTALSLLELRHCTLVLLKFLRGSTEYISGDREQVDPDRVNVARR